MSDQAKGSGFYLLGAGFSRAISSAMPLLPDLAGKVLAALGRDERTLQPFGGNLEHWMSHISVEQPWLTDSENLVNRALFLRASGAVQAAIEQAESAAVCDPPPDWLLRLASEMCREGADVASFNYDLLLERSVSHLGLVSTWTDLYAIPLEGRYPPGSTPFVAPNEPTGEVAALYKLHGSVNWAYGGIQDHPGARIVLRPSEVAWAPGSQRQARALPRDARLFEDLVPLIVPPTSAKNPFYSNGSLRAQWRLAHAAAMQAERLIIIGFSFPESDLQVRHFLATAATQSTSVTVVDFCPRVADKVRDLLPGAPEVVGHYGRSGLSDFVDARCGDLVRWGVLPADEGWDVYITVNAVSAVDFDNAAERPFDRQDDSSSASGWLRWQIEKRWPDITTDKASRDPQPNPASGGHSGYMAYTKVR